MGAGRRPHSTFADTRAGAVGQNAAARSGRASHFAFWVDDLEARVEKTQAREIKKLSVPPYAANTTAHGEKAAGKVLTCLFEDPDGTILQFDQRLK